jgi:hypothetical protein
MTKRAYVAIPAELVPQFEAVSEALGMNVNQFGVRCLKGIMAAIEAEKLEEVHLVRHVRRILRKDATAADRLLLDLLEETFPDLPKQPPRFQELLLEEANRILGKLTKEKLERAYSIVQIRYSMETSILDDVAKGKLKPKKDDAPKT